MPLEPSEFLPNEVWVNPTAIHPFSSRIRSILKSGRIAREKLFKRIHHYLPLRI